MYKDGKYTPLSLEEAVDIAANLLMILNATISMSLELDYNLLKILDWEEM